MSSRRLGKGRTGPWRQAGWAAAVVAGALALAWAVTGPGAAARDETAGALPADLARVPADSVALGSLRLADLLGSSLVKPILDKKETAKEVSHEVPSGAPLAGQPHAPRRDE